MSEVDGSPRSSALRLAVDLFLAIALATSMLVVCLMAPNASMIVSVGPTLFQRGRQAPATRGPTPAPDKVNESPPVTASDVPPPLETSHQESKGLITETSPARPRNPGLARAAVPSVSEMTRPVLRTLPEISARQPPSGTVDFFGKVTEASSVVFVVDCSSSMSGEPFQQVCAELAGAACKLGSEQRYYVIFFNEGAVYVVPGAPRFYHATALHALELLNVLRTFEARGGTNPEPSMTVAASLDPDLIELLTDGHFAPFGSQLVQFLKSRKIKVNTTGIGAGCDAHLLQRIAAESGGSYRNVSLSGRQNQIEPDVFVLMLAGLLTELETASTAELSIYGDALVRARFPETARIATGDSTGLRARCETAVREQLALVAPQVDSMLLGTWLAGADIRRKNAAVQVFLARSPEEWSSSIVELLKDSDDRLVQAIREALRHVASHRDYGPEPGASIEEKEAAAALWTSWRKRETLRRQMLSWPREKLLQAANDPEEDRRWAAVVLLVQNQAADADMLIAHLADPMHEIAGEAAGGLANLIKPGSLGPHLQGQAGRYILDALLELFSKGGQHEAQALQALKVIATANSRHAVPQSDNLNAWTEWWIDEKDRAAVGPMRLARQHFDAGRFAPALKRFRDIAETYPDTPTAREASRMAELCK